MNSIAPSHINPDHPRAGAWHEHLQRFVHRDGHVDHSRGANAWVAGGAPVGEDPPTVAAAFVASARAAGARAAFFAPEPSELHPSALQKLVIGWQGWWHPGQWQATLHGSASLRAQLRRARSKGVTIRLLDDHALAGAWGAAVDELARQWLARREMAPLGFVVSVPAPLAATARSHGARVWGAVVGDQLVAVAVLLAPRPGSRQWLLQHLLRVPAAPNGTSELLVDAVLGWLGEREIRAGERHELSLGMVPLHGDVPRPLRWIGRLTRGLFDFAGLHRFKEKLRPHRRVPVTLEFVPAAGAGVRAVSDVLVAFASHRPLHFALATIARGPRLLIHTLAWLLVPWTALLAFVAPVAWFPAPAVRAFWIAFDLLLMTALFIWRGRHRVAWLRGLTVAVAVDACLTTVQVASHNLPRRPDVWEAAACLVALAGPWLSFMLLARATRRLTPRPAPRVPAA